MKKPNTATGNEIEPSMIKALSPRPLVYCEISSTELLLNAHTIAILCTPQHHLIYKLHPLCIPTPFDPGRRRFEIYKLFSQVRLFDTMTRASVGFRGNNRFRRVLSMISGGMS